MPRCNACQERSRQFSSRRQCRSHSYMMNTQTKDKKAITEYLFYRYDGAMRIEDQVLGGGTENQFAHL